MGLLKDFKYHTPVSLKEALVLLKKAKKPYVLGGGTFALNHLKKAAQYPTDVVGLKKILALRGIKETKGAVIVGAMTTIAEIAESVLIARYFSALADASAKLATTPLRHMATIGGNVASRFFWVDLPAVLIALRARVTYASLKSEKTVDLEDFLRHKPVEPHIVTKISLQKKKSFNVYFRHTKTMEVDVPFLALAFCASVGPSRCRDVRCVINTTTSFPVVLNETEQVFERSALKNLSIASVRESLAKDLKEAGLDEFRVHCVENDFESLIGILKTG